ncbi:MAG: hypothetical protein WC788_07270 [Candidatus Paceibacterota bacterium]|jgi:uncharacterized protein (DUF952 family)
MNAAENKITDKNIVPKVLFHLVPKNLFLKYLSQNGDYDCRNKEEWGMNSKFIHTTTRRKDLKEQIADVKWKNYPREREFVMLKIYSNRIKSDLTYAIYDSITYYHIWEALANNSFEVIDVNRNDDGSFNI